MKKSILVFSFILLSTSAHAAISSGTGCGATLSCPAGFHAAQGTNGSSCGGYYCTNDTNLVSPMNLVTPVKSTPSSVSVQATKSTTTAVSK